MSSTVEDKMYDVPRSILTFGMEPPKGEGPAGESYFDNPLKCTREFKEVDISEGIALVRIFC